MIVFPKNLVNLDKKTTVFIKRFYVFYLGTLYVILLCLSTFVSMRRVPNIDWFFQLELMSLSLIGFGVFCLGLLSVCYGTFRLIVISKPLATRLRLSLITLSLVIPVFMFGIALLFILSVISIFR
jgi:hypothetical protein